MKFLILLLTVVVCLATFAKAQDVVNFDGGKVIKNAPFSAEVLSESTQILNGGNKLTRSVTTKIARDGEGRFYREQKFVSAGVNEPQTTILVLDNVAGFKYILNPATKIGRRIKLGETETTKIEPAKSTFGEPKIEQLGKKTIEGVETAGTRSTVEVAAGAIGNEKAFEITYERWFSKDLGIIIYSKHIDPRFGEQTYRVSNIIRQEPDKSLFTPPADYRILDGVSPLKKTQPTKNKQ